MPTASRFSIPKVRQSIVVKIWNGYNSSRKPSDLILHSPSSVMPTNEPVIPTIPLLCDRDGETISRRIGWPERGLSIEIGVLGNRRGRGVVAYWRMTGGPSKSARISVGTRIYQTDRKPPRGRFGASRRIVDHCSGSMAPCA